MTIRLLLATLAGLILSGSVLAQEFAPEHHERVAEHAPWGHPIGNPWNGNIKWLARTAYVSAYDEHENGGRVPMWGCYRVNRDFLKKNVKRKGKLCILPWRSRRDQSCSGSGVRRILRVPRVCPGHLALWAVMGGDRDGGELFAGEISCDQSVTAAVSSSTAKLGVASTLFRQCERMRSGRDRGLPGGAQWLPRREFACCTWPETRLDPADHSMCCRRDPVWDCDGSRPLGLCNRTVWWECRRSPTECDPWVRAA